MDAITMPSITSLVSRLESDFPAYVFVAGDSFHWSPSDNRIYYDPSVDEPALLMHELSHAILNHHHYSKDIALIEMERDAWQHAGTVLAQQYDIAINDGSVQDALDTYRDWLHARSTCPDCKATGVQVQKSQYKCIACTTKWRVNEARVCALRRYRL